MTEQLLREVVDDPAQGSEAFVTDMINMLDSWRVRLAFSWFVLAHGGRQRFASSIAVDTVHRIGPRIASLRYPVIASLEHRTHRTAHRLYPHRAPRRNSLLPGYLIIASTFAHRLPTALIRGRRMVRILLHYIGAAAACALWGHLFAVRSAGTTLSAKSFLQTEAGVPLKGSDHRYI